ncbi:HelD family protein [Alicyclobacillus tolerans]|uniref:HelD family protein n=1 Tax=Alicyclobacillus tolerans TaxID=90970 RepID=UPI003B813CC3
METESATTSATDQLIQEEASKLKETLAWIDQSLKRLENIPREFPNDEREPQTADEVAAQAVDRLRDERIDALRRSTQEPYFGRLDFQTDGQVEPEIWYIGKRGLQDDTDGTIRVLDWRAPAASIFYAHAGQDRATYQAPDGEISGTVWRKRNLAIRRGQLERVVDSFVRGEQNGQVTDEFLLYRLQEGKDNRLRDIVATIQAEQDTIIRAEKNRAIFIQGVAGSGKTTVALHRLAYLLYQHSEQLKAEKMAIFAPHPMFMEYISEVLPELGVGGVLQTTFSEFALRELDYRFKLIPEGQRVQRWFETGMDSASREFATIYAKGRLAWLKRLQQAVSEAEQMSVPDVTFTPWPGVQLEAHWIRKWFTEDYRHYALAVRVMRVQARVKRWMDMEYKRVQAEDRQKKLKKAANTAYQSYLKLWPALDEWTMYQNLMPEAWQQSLSQVKRKRGERIYIWPEDLASLLYLRLVLYGVQPDAKLQHVVIDEAQDFSPVQLAILRFYCQTDSFTILGDLAQSIYSYSGVQNWEELSGLFSEESVQNFQLQVSYRSTQEIVEFAKSAIAAYPHLPLPVPVYRSGEAVNLLHYTDQTAQQKELLKCIDSWQSEGRMHSIAVLCPNEELAQHYADLLQSTGYKATQVTWDQREFSGGLSVMPAYLAKGLEFDAVLLTDVSQHFYPGNESYAKLLYVASTRALHRLAVLYSEREPSPLLSQALHSLD